MIKFKEFLKEEWKKGNEHLHYHDQNVGGHRVTIMMSHHGNEKHSWSADFMVNGDTNKAADLKQHGAKILRHVKRKITDFVAKQKDTDKPVKQIHFSASDSNSSVGEKKSKVYKKMAGKNKVSGTGLSSAIHFEELKTYFDNLLREENEKE